MQSVEWQSKELTQQPCIVDDNQYSTRHDQAEIKQKYQSSKKKYSSEMAGHTHSFARTDDVQIEYFVLMSESSHHQV
jgi:hypothetical protein